uniref:Uncharacterized protein n=1 Tax=viral metagenome TaxID=1070528 RepID=A0A6C0E226_9ZZZZ
MSLAMYAAPFDNNDTNELYTHSGNDTLINRKRTNHNKTQKRNSLQENNSQKVNAVLESIHKSSFNEDNDLGDFRLMPPPTSVGVENTKIRENMSNQKEADVQANDNDNVDLQSLKNNYMNDKIVQEYYKNIIPNYNQSVYQKSEHNKPYYSVNQYPSDQMNSYQDDNYATLLDKLNYMINLLEEQHDERTNNVTEEVVLYSFLGVFIIFIVDSFARVGKYSR